MSAAKCETGWGEGLSTLTLCKARDFHPTPPLRVDPPPPGEGKKARVFEMAFSLNVVPAKAGTHTPWPIVEGCYSTAFAQHTVLWLWVPAFAGTTMWRHGAIFSRRNPPEVCHSISRPLFRGRRECRALVRPQPRVVW
jgi:hypothetical protein